ncbi:MAG TPA: lytic transglycosylase domain-containing protein [Fibrobacteria bacterium]|nr:lytic transglycosylase domain-containing protein [Fibrobacteria bacterium]
MPAIPLYQSQITPSGSLNIAPSSAGGLEGRSLQGVAGAVEKIAQVGVSVSRDRIAEDERFRKQAEDRRLEDIDFSNRSWASRTFADAQLAVVQAVNEAQRNRQQGQITSSTAIRQQGETWMETALKGAPSEDARRYAEANIRSAWASAERTAVENDDQYRTQWGIRQFNEANDSQQIAIQDAPPNMVDDSFLAAAHNIRTSLSALSLDPETKAKLGEKMLSESVIRSGTRIIQAEGPDKFLDIISGMRREMAGKKKITRPGNGRWSVEIQQASQETGVDPSLIEAVMSVESGGDIGKSSAKGALGLMQLMPDTARELGVDPTKPEQNVLGGAKYLAKMLKRYGGNEAKALAAYNAGPGAVDKAGGVTNFKETKAYVAKVKAERDRFKSAQGEMKISPNQIPEWWQAATADDRDKLVGTALRMQQELATANLQYLDTWKRNADAAQTNGLPVPGSPSQQTVLAAFAGNETKASNWYQQNIKPFDDIRNLSTQMGGMTISEMDRQIDALRPKAGRSGDPNLAADMQRVNAAENAKRNILEQRSRDPMSQAFQQPAVRSLSADPEKQLAAAVAWQRENVPEGKRTVLFDDDRQVLADAWMNPQATGGGIPVIEKMQAKYGSYFDDALLEIAPKAPSDALLFAGMNVDPKTASARARMRMLASKSLDEIVVGNETKKKQATESVSRAFAPFFSSFKQTNSIEGAKYIENIMPAITKYAVSFMNEGLDPRRAAQRAFDEVVRSQYDFLDGGKAPDGRAQVRIPRAMGADEGLRSMLEDGLDEVIAKPPKELAFPAGVSRADGLDGSYWATSANDRGAVLMFRGAPVRVVHEGKLVPFELSWSAIANAGKRYQTMR